MIENERLEYEKCLGELKEALISIAAMPGKHGGGELWSGLNNDGTPVGLDVTDKTLRDLSQAIAAHIEPKAYPTISAELMGGKHCVKVTFVGEDALYYAYGRAYIRVADRDRQLSAKELENRILDKNQEYLRWDNKFSDTALADLDEGKARKYVETAGLAWDTLPNALEKMGVLRGGKLLNPPRCSSAKNWGSGFGARCSPRRPAPQSSINTITTARSWNSSKRCRSISLKTSTLACAWTACTEWTCRRFPRPPCARRSSMLFATVTTVLSTKLRIAVVKDCIEIRNPGSLFGGLTTDNLRKGNISKRRNPLIADLLRRIHMVEGWGCGIPLILEQEPKVRFRETAQIFIKDFIRHAIEEGGTTTINDKTSTIARVCEHELNLVYHHWLYRYPFR